VTAFFGLAELVAAILGVIAFVALYTRRAPWWRSEVGRWLVTYPIALGLLLINGVVFRVIGDYPGRQTVNLVLFGVIAGSVWWSFALLYRAKKKERRR
jgi:uncharacterized membrane protein